MRIAGTVSESIVDGPGLRLTVFTQGCPHRCPGCHNPQTHDPAGGREETTTALLARYTADPLLDGLTISGGEPMEQAAECAALAEAVHALGGNVWVYTGWRYEALVQESDPARLRLLAAADVLVDGPYVEAERSLELRWRGSRNQRLIDLNATQAAIRAGYSPKTAAAIAAENLTKPKVAENIKKRMNEKEDALIAKQDEVLKYLTAVMRREMKEFVVVTCMEEKTEVIPGEGGSKPTRRTTKKEEPKVVEIPARLCDANKAAELLGKRYGLFTDRVDVSGSLPVILAGEDALDD